MTAPEPHRHRPLWRAGGQQLRLGAAVALACAGLIVHNLADLPGQTVISPESLVPTLIWLFALGLCVAPTTRKVGLWALLGWAVVNLVGGALSVLPLPMLPFAPEQTVRHYAFHAVYAATQIPAVVIAAMGVRLVAVRPSRSSRLHRSGH